MLEKLDTSDMLGRTRKFCEAVVPDHSSKQEAFYTIFEGSDDLSLLHLEELCRGFAPFTQRDLLDDFVDEFFDKIEDFVNDKAWSISRFVFHFLSPTHKATQEELDRFIALKD